MKINGLFILIICFCSINCWSQKSSEVLLYIPKEGTSITDFIPKGYDTIRTAHGDLNKDGKEDIVMVLKDVREDKTESGSEIREKNRLLLILFSTGKGWQLAGKSGDVILCEDCGGMHGDPFGDISVENGLVATENDLGTSDRMVLTRKFRYQDNGFYLIGRTDSYFNVNNLIDNPGEVAGTVTEINLVTGDQIECDVCDSCKVREKRSKIKTKPLIKLEDYKYEE